MPQMQIPFLKTSEKDRDKDKERQATSHSHSASGSGSGSGPSPHSPGILPIHPHPHPPTQHTASSSSIDIGSPPPSSHSGSFPQTPNANHHNVQSAQIAGMGADVNNSGKGGNGGNAGNGVSVGSGGSGGGGGTPSSTSKFNPSRLLRRKASLSAKASASANANANTNANTGTSTTASVSDIEREREREPPLPGSSISSYSFEQQPLQNQPPYSPTTSTRLQSFSHTQAQQTQAQAQSPRQGSFSASAAASASATASGVPPQHPFFAQAQAQAHAQAAAQAQAAQALPPTPTSPRSPRYPQSSSQPHFNTFAGDSFSISTPQANTNNTAGHARRPSAQTPEMTNKRSAWIYDQRLNVGAEEVVVIPGFESRDSLIEEEGEGGDTIKVDRDAALRAQGGTPNKQMGSTHSLTSPSGTSHAKLGAGTQGTHGLGIGMGGGVFGKIAQDQDALVEQDRKTHQRPLTPPSSAPTSASASTSMLSDKQTFYPTALSPPRRPMPRSPRAMRNQTPTTHSQRASTPSTPPNMQPLGAMGTPSSLSSSRNDSAHRADLASAPTATAAATRTASPSPLPRVSTGTSGWLARRPSTSTYTSTPSRRHRPSLSASPSISSPAAAVLSTPRRSLAESPHIESTSKLEGSRRARTGSFSSTTGDETSASASSDLDFDGEVGITTVLRRQSLLGTPSRPSPRSQRRPSIATATATSSQTQSGSYQVQVHCLDSRQETDEMKWEVTIRRHPPRNSINAPSSPLQLSTASSITQAPGTASSINLSLSLDQPTGKLVFISFPMDIHATPTRRRRPSTAPGHGAGAAPTGDGKDNRAASAAPAVQSQNRSTFSGAVWEATDVLSPKSGSRPDSASASAPDTASSSRSGTTTPESRMSKPPTPPAPAQSTPTTPSSRRKAPPPWPSPKTEDKATFSSPGLPARDTPDGLPQDIFTPRGTRLVHSPASRALHDHVTADDY